MIHVQYVDWGRGVPVVVAPGALELVEDGVVLVQPAQFVPERGVHLVARNRSTLHVQIPHLFL